MNLIDKLPKSYSEINYKTYIKILQTIPDEIPDGWDVEEYNTYILLVPIAILLGMDVSDIERLPAAELIPMIERLSFMNEPFKDAKTSLKLVDANSLTYDSYVNYQKLRLDQWSNMDKILSIIIKDKTPEEIDQLSINEVMQCFFILNRSTMKLLQSYKICLAKNLMKQIMKRIWSRIISLFKVASLKK